MIGSQQYLLEDVLEPGLRLVLCGTALGKTSAEQKAYYARGGNQFWPMLFETGLVTTKIEPKNYRRVLDYRIGLTDLCKTSFGNDDQIPQDEYDIDALHSKIIKYAPLVLAFTSKNAGQIFMKASKINFGWQDSLIGSTRIFILPSPSPRARRSWKANRHYWHELASEVLSA